MNLDTHSSINSEQYVIGCCLESSTQTVFDDTRHRLSAENFFREYHQIIFRAMESIRDSGRPITLKSVELKIRQSPDAKKFGEEPNAILAYLMECVRESGLGYNAEEMIQHVLDLSRRRELRGILSKHEKSLQDPSVPAEDTANEIEADLLRANKKSSQGGPVWAIDITDSAINQILSYQDAQNTTTIPTMIDDLNRKIGGLKPSEFVLIAGRPSMGKTTLGMNIADAVVENKKLPALFFSLEMQKQQLMERRISAISRVPLKKITGKSRLTDAERDRVIDAGKVLKERPLLIDDTRGRTVGQICSLTRKHHARDGICAVFVDYLQLVTDDQSGKSKERHLEVAQISRRLFDLAGNLNIPVIAMSQLNRESSQRKDNRPMISDMRESGSLEQDADIILMLHWAWYYQREEQQPPPKTQSLLIVGKNRNGETGDVPVGINAECSYFYNLPSESEEALKQGKTVSLSDSNGSAF